MECKYVKKSTREKCTRKSVIKKGIVSDYCAYHNQINYRKNYYKQKYTYNSLDYYKKLTNEQKENKIVQLKNKIKVLQQLLS